MGAPLSEEEEKAALKEISQLSEPSRKWIGHHIRNAITPLLLACDCDTPQEDREEIVNTCLDHIKADLERAGC